MVEKIAVMDYHVMLGNRLSDVKTWLPNKTVSQVVIITDHYVKKQYGLRLQKYLQQAGQATVLFSFPAGEKYKNYETKLKIIHAMQKQHCDRDTLIIALGGGVVGDLAGFIASTFLRGVAYIQIPTTLLAMVDSSVGGKTGINTIYGKNTIGVIYQPKCVLADVQLLKTLPKKHRINGLIEAIKMFFTHDAQSLQFTMKHVQAIVNGDMALLNEVVARAVKIKAAVVARDEKEMAERSVLNFGHTIGHALENMSNYRLLHGYAVAYGMIVEATISHLLGILDKEQLSLLKHLFIRLGIQGKDLKKYDLTQLIQTTKHDKKNRLQKTHYVLLREIGKVYIKQNQYVHPVPDKTVIEAFQHTIAE